MSKYKFFLIYLTIVLISLKVNYRGFFLIKNNLILWKKQLGKVNFLITEQISTFYYENIGLMETYFTHLRKI